MRSLDCNCSSNAAADEDLPATAGFAAAAVTVALLGTNHVPIKQFDSYDGMSYQLHRAIGIWVIGLLVNVIRSFPHFHPSVMIGGAVWATGSLCVVPIIQTIGMGLGLLIWGTTSMLSGWASGRFGWFNIPPQVPHSTMLNYIGVALSAASAVILFFISPTDKPISDDADDAKEISSSRCQSASKNGEGLTARESMEVEKFIFAHDALGTEAIHSQQVQPLWIRLNALGKKALGISLALFCGPTFGLAFKPSYYVQSHVNGASQSGLDYVFAHFTGIVCTSMLYFYAYAAAMRNRPAVNPRVILPAFLSGIMWGVACSAWFVANEVLSESVSFPIVTSGPAVVAAFWGVCVFKEIKGTHNLRILSIAFITCLTGSVLTGLSK